MISGLTACATLFTDMVFSTELGFLELLFESVNETIVFLISVILAIALTVLLAIQLRLVWVNQTTMELSLDPWKTPYRNASIGKNLKVVFGRRKLFWPSPFHAPFGAVLSGKSYIQVGNKKVQRKEGLGVAPDATGIDYIQSIIPSLRSRM